MEMDEEYIDNVKNLIEQKEAENVKALLIDLHPADIAELCNDLSPEEARFVYRLLDNETAADVLMEMDEDVRKEFLEILPSETIAKRFVDLGCYIAYGGAATFKRNDDVREAFAATPLDRILFETDCPYMAPEPIRGLECEPAMISITARSEEHTSELQVTT